MKAIKTIEAKLQKLNSDYNYESFQGKKEYSSLDFKKTIKETDVRVNLYIGGNTGFASSYRRILFSNEKNALDFINSLN